MIVEPTPASTLCSLSSDNTRLWASGTILVRNQDEEDPDKINVFIPRNLICSISGRVRDIVPTARSWPVIEWKTIANGGWRNRIEMDVWPWMPEFIKFLHTGARVFDDHEDAYYTGEWCLGAVLDCPEYQNAIMKEMLRSETLVETDMVGMGEDENELLRMFVDTYAHHLPRIGVTSIGNGKLDRSNKLAAYIIDLMVWEGIRGGFHWLTVVHKGGCVANILARAQVDAAKKSAPRFPPWHVFNRHKYLMDEKHPTAELKRGGEKGPGGSKKRGRAA